MAVKERLDKLMKRPVVAHALAANERYNVRLGPQFAAGITYFSVLSMVPVLMFAFAALGMTLTVVRPDLMDVVQSMINSTLSDKNLSVTVGAVVTNAFQQWASIGTIALVTAVYSGSNWVGNLKRAIRVMWSKEILDATARKNFVVELALNVLIFLGLLVCIAVSIATATLGSAFSRTVVEWLGWSHVPGIGFFFAVLSLVLSLVASWILMAFLFMVLPDQPAAPRAWFLGTVIGAVALAVIQQLAGRLMSVFGGNNAVSVFGPVIVIMLLFNIIATVILMSAAWVGSSDDWREQSDEHTADGEPAATPDAATSASATSGDHTAGQESRWAATRSLDDLRGADQTIPDVDPRRYVREDVAARGMRVNLGLGYVVGAATGVGVGAAIIGLVRRLFNRRR